MADDISAMNRHQQGVLLAGAAATILSFFPGFIRVTFEGNGFDVSTNAWTGSATIGMLLILGATMVVGFKALNDAALPGAVPWYLVAVVAAVLGTLLVIVRALTAGTSAPGAHVGPGWSGWLLIVMAVVLTVFAVLTFRDSDEKLLVT